ncbi:MAG: VOC family protein [Gammaproteobacteria bacterium]
MRLPTGRTPFQQAWVVNDIEQTARSWSASLNIGPFYIAEYTPDMFEFIDYRGGAGSLHMKTAIAYSGDSQIELVEPLGTAPSIYRDVYENGQTGFHHLCFWSDEFERDLEHHVSQGHVIANEGKMKRGPRFAYVDATETLNCVIEVLERRPALVALFDEWREAAKSWDGKRPVVKL